MFGRKKPPRLRLETVEKFCSDPAHYKNIMDYGSHPKRQYAICFAHDPPQIVILSWKDPYARVMNRMIALFPAIVALAVAALTVIFLVLPYIP